MRRGNGRRSKAANERNRVDAVGADATRAIPRSKRASQTSRRSTHPKTASTAEPLPVPSPTSLAVFANDRTRIGPAVQSG